MNLYTDGARTGNASIHRLNLLFRRSTPLAVFVPVCVILYLLIIAFGNPPQALGLDPAWTEVQAWGFMNHAQWGPDFINTYGPLGFLHPFSAYVSGIFPAFATGQIALTAAFVLAVALMFRRASIGEFALFALVYVCWFFKLIGEVSWLLTMPFATVWLINSAARNSRAGYFALILLAPIFSAIALTKFTAIPIWVFCVATASCVCLLERNWRRALLIPVVFAIALVVAWRACGQDILNLPLYLWSGLETAYGYRHAQGLRAPAAVEALGLAVLFCFIAACAHAAWRMRRDLSAVASVGLFPLTAALLWLAYFTRADEFHWPSFFAAMSLLPFAFWCNRHVIHGRASYLSMGAIILACTLVGLWLAPPDTILPRALERIRSNLHDLSHLAELHEQREAQWRAAGDSAALPGIRQRVGKARIDMVTWQQGIVLLNGLTYAPRPVFQSHIAATPELARLNEAYFLGPRAPDFVLFQLNNMDNRFPMSEDNLAMMVLLKRYRPVLLEKGYLLLQLDAATANTASITPDGPAMSAGMGVEIPIEAAHGSVVGFIAVEPTWLGKLYTLLFPEPALQVAIRTSDGELRQHRLVRLTASSGFLIDPLLESTHDWLKLYFSKTLARSQSLRIDTELPWARVLFQSEFKLSWGSIAILHADPSTASAELRGALYPGFNLLPTEPTDLRVVVEGDRDSIFLHAPASIFFEPNRGHYRISATFGIQESALTAPDCQQADPDGVGASFVLHHAGHESVLEHADVDPFHAERDRGPHRLRTGNVDVDAGDRIEYRVDPGRAGKNTDCDWSYVRDLVFRAGSSRSAVVNARERIFDEGFE